MFERLQKPFLTVETGEAYQPIRVMYEIKQPSELAKILSGLKCIESTGSDKWNWHWKEECSDIHFESIESLPVSRENLHRLGTITLKNNALYLSLPSFKRACLAVPFFYKHIPSDVATVQKADFVNKVFGIGERLPHGFTELFNEDELQAIIKQRSTEYEEVQLACEQATSADEALKLIEVYTQREAEKKLPFAERYVFELESNTAPDISFLSFYIYLRGRELVAIRRWFGKSTYSLADAAEETMEQVFGDMDIDIID